MKKQWFWQSFNTIRGLTNFVNKHELGPDDFKFTAVYTTVGSATAYYEILYYAEVEII